MHRKLYYQFRILKNYSSSAFTIVELLVVIVVIGILASITTAVYSGINFRARDAKRTSDLAALEQALEMNYIKYGAYTQPEDMCTDTSYGGDGSCGAVSGSGNWDQNSDLRDLVSDGFIRQLPVDPINDSTYRYTYEPNNAGEQGIAAGGQGYTLCANKLEVTGSSYCITKLKK